MPTPPGVGQSTQHGALLEIQCRLRKQTNRHDFKDSGMVRQQTWQTPAPVSRPRVRNFFKAPQHYQGKMKLPQLPHLIKEKIRPKRSKNKKISQIRSIIQIPTIKFLIPDREETDIEDRIGARIAVAHVRTNPIRIAEKDTTTSSRVLRIGSTAPNTPKR